MEQIDNTVITVKTKDYNIVQELPWDVNGEQFCNAFYTAAIGITFTPETILRAMRDFAEERLPEEE